MKNIKFLLSLIVAFAACFFLQKEITSTEILFAATVVTPDVTRGHLAIFVDYIRNKYGLASIAEMDLVPYHCRLLVDLANGTSQYKINPKEGYKGSTAALLAPGAELKLEDDTICFFPLMRIATRKNDTANSVLGPVFTYEDKAHHDDTTGIGEIASLHSLYNGNYSIKTGNNTRVKENSIEQFRVVPGQQKEEATDVLTFWPQYGPSDLDKGFRSIPPTLILDTNETNIIEINLVGPTSAIAGATNKKNILQIDFMGWVFNLKGSNKGCA